MSKLNKSVRFLVLNRTNEVVVPRDEMLPGFDPSALKAGGEISRKYSPSFKNEAMAKAFGAALAGKYPGERFYLAKIVAGCVVEPQDGPWVATGASLADDTTAEILDTTDGIGDDDLDNE